MATPHIALWVALVALTGDAGATLPPGYQVLVRGSTADAQALPASILLPSGPHSIIGLGMSLRTIPHTESDLILYNSDNRTISVVRIPQFNNATFTAIYFDPEQNRTRPALLFPGGNDGLPTIVLDGGETGSLATLLEPQGAMVLVRIPRPQGIFIFSDGFESGGT